MWKIASIFFLIVFIVTMPITEILRSIVHARREKRYGLGGTQDIAMWGTLTGFAFLLLAAICFGVDYALGR